MDNQQGNLLQCVDVGNQARVLLAEFIRQRIIASGLETDIDDDPLISPNTPRGPELQHAQEIGAALRRIGDELDGDQHLQSLIDSVSPFAPKQSFMRVAHEIFSDGIINWGRVVALFYFAFKLALRVISNRLSVMLRNIVEWVVEFIVNRVANWIIGRGGWEAIHEYFIGSSVRQMAAVILGAVLACAFIYWRSSAVQ